MASHYSRRDWLRMMSILTGASAVSFSSWARNERGEKIILPDNPLHKPLAKPVTAITCGAGNRGNVYGGFSLQYPDQLDIIGVAEPVPFRNERYSKKHNI